MVGRVVSTKYWREQEDEFLNNIHGHTRSHNWCILSVSYSGDQGDAGWTSSSHQLLEARRGGGGGGGGWEDLASPSHIPAVSVMGPHMPSKDKDKDKDKDKNKDKYWRHKGRRRGVRGYDTVSG